MVVEDGFRFPFRPFSPDFTTYREIFHRPVCLLVKSHSMMNVERTEEEKIR
jgi:hypothetical protein